MFLNKLKNAAIYAAGHIGWHVPFGIKSKFEDINISNIYHDIQDTRKDYRSTPKLEDTIRRLDQNKKDNAIFFEISRFVSTVMTVGVYTFYQRLLSFTSQQNQNENLEDYCFALLCGYSFGTIGAIMGKHFWQKKIKSDIEESLDNIDADNYDGYLPLESQYNPVTNFPIKTKKSTPAVNRIKKMFNEEMPKTINWDKFDDGFNRYKLN